MKSNPKGDLVIDALLTALWRRKPESRVLIHSDQGVQYTCADWRGFVRDNNLELSMSRRGNCHDNGVAESFFSLLKGGRNHINEQLQSYWIELFQKNGFRCLDVIRPATRENDEVECWYRQNTFLFIDDSVADSTFNNLTDANLSVYDTVHSLVFQRRIEGLLDAYKNPKISHIFSSFYKYILNLILRKKSSEP